ncbi:hypothetical protein PsorP6_002402 [Peronosclerospora sorghi]|uniref:Uncharacterized protein n=1 Tax=Peronosclerospora sorghi TaxID=230839 RepID=A0ACC0WS20_9STRA|nr:hypothetical protein PsorP6_002402 [Peronosclerospora sorghi]
MAFEVDEDLPGSVLLHTMRSPLYRFEDTGLASQDQMGDQAAVAKRTARRLQSNPISAARNDTLTRTKSSANLSSKPAQQGCQPPFDDFQPVTRERASSDGGQSVDDIPLIEDEELLRPSFSSCLSSITAIDSSTNSSKKEKKSTLRIRCYEGKFQNRQGQLLFYFSLFPPDKTAMRGIILHLHDMGDHCRRSAPLYERFCSEGFCVITYDLLNHGASDYDKFNTRVHISNFDDYVDDTNDFITFGKNKIYKAALCTITLITHTEERKNARLHQSCHLLFQALHLVLSTVYKTIYTHPMASQYVAGMAFYW